MNLIGKMLANRYEILEKIGNGGMATVYRAKCHVLNRFVAVKVLKDEFITDVEFIKRFKSEAQTAASLTHPNIVSIYDVGNEGDIYYIVMELIQGKTLKEIILEDGKLSWKWSVNIVIQIASALETAHKNNLIHRDIKPHNIIITEDGMAKVTDFGIAKAVSNSTITAFGTTIGSVHYFSPEHAKGGATDAKSDIYSLGVVMYEMLTGRVPFDADTPVSVALMQVQEEPIEPIKLNPQIPISVNNIILKAMQKDPADRYQNATEMLIDLSTALKRPNDNFVKLNKKFDTLQTQKLSTLYDIDGKVRKNNSDDVEDDDDEEEIRPKKKNKKRGLFGFLKDHVFLSIVLLGILIFGIALGGTIIFMNATRTPDIQIPNLVTSENGERLTEQQAKSKYADTEFSKQNELKIEYITEGTDESGEKVDPGYVIKQEPPYVPDRKIKEHDQITIYVSVERQPEVLTMVDLTGKTEKEARTMLEELGYKGEITVEKESSDDLAKDLIIRQTIEKGIQFKDIDPITIVVSTGTDKVKVTPVLGQKESAAKKELEGLGLKVKVEYTEDAEKTDGIVLEQSISNELAEPGSTITIKVNKLPKKVTGTVIVNVASLTNYETQLDEEGNSIPPEKVAVTVDIKDSEGNSILSQTRSITENTTDHTVTFQASGKVQVEVSVGEEGKVFSDTLDLDTKTSLTAE